MFNFKSLIIAFVFSVSLINEAYSIIIDVRTNKNGIVAILMVQFTFL